MARRTTAIPASLTGVGLHTGTTTTLTCRPAGAGDGVRFRRVDLPHRPMIAARASEVETTERRTALGTGEATIHTVEHLLATVGALGYDDLLLELDGPEPPIGDGSFMPFVDLFDRAGVCEIEGKPEVLRVEAPFVISEGASRYVVAPSVEPGLHLTATIEWDHPLIGCQTGRFVVSSEVFRREIAAARTFGFTSEVEGLQADGLLKGASTENAVVLSETEVLGTTLRWPDEFLRHKVGDIIGDLLLAGGRVQADIVAHRPSHTGNVAVARAIARTVNRQGGAMDITQILDLIPHRYPMLLVDRILEIEEDRIVGLKNVTINEPFFQGHFPGHPIMPGVLIIEAMAQVGGFLMMGSVEHPETKVVYFMSLDKVKFRKPVIPGDQLRFEVTMLKHRGRTCQMKGMAWVAGQLVAEAEMMARVVDR